MGNVRVVDLGSVSLAPKPSDLREAKYTLLEADAEGLSLETLFALNTITRAVITALEHTHHPGGAILLFNSCAGRRSLRLAQILSAAEAARLGLPTLYG